MPPPFTLRGALSIFSLISLPITAPGAFGALVYRCFASTPYKRPLSFLFLAAYAIFYYTDTKTPSTRPRVSPWIRYKLPLWHMSHDYFYSNQTPRYAKLNEKRTYLITMHNHGIFCYSGWMNYVSQRGAFTDLKDPALANIPANFSIPFLRDVCMAIGLVPADKRSLMNLLTTKQNTSILLGGSAEAAALSEKANRVVIASRYGFVQLALEADTPALMIFHMGEPRTYSAPFQHTTKSNSKQSLQHQSPIVKAVGAFQQFFLKTMTFAMPLTIGAYGMVPHAVPLTMVTNETPLDFRVLVELYFFLYKNNYYLGFSPQCPCCFDYDFVTDWSQDGREQKNAMRLHSQNKCTHQHQRCGGGRGGDDNSNNKKNNKNTHDDDTTTNDIQNKQHTQHLVMDKNNPSFIRPANTTLFTHEPFPIEYHLLMENSVDVDWDQEHPPQIGSAEQVQQQTNNHQQNNRQQNQQKNQQPPTTSSNRLKPIDTKYHGTRLHIPIIQHNGDVSSGDGVELFAMDVQWSKIPKQIISWLLLIYIGEMCVLYDRYSIYNNKDNWVNDDNVLEIADFDPKRYVLQYSQYFNYFYEKQQQQQQQQQEQQQEQLSTDNQHHSGVITQPHSSSLYNIPQCNCLYEHLTSSSTKNGKTNNNNNNNNNTTTKPPTPQLPKNCRYKYHFGIDIHRFLLLHQYNRQYILQQLQIYLRLKQQHNITNTPVQFNASGGVVEDVQVVPLPELAKL